MRCLSVILFYNFKCYTMLSMPTQNYLWIQNRANGRCGKRLGFTYEGSVLLILSITSKIVLRTKSGTQGNLPAPPKEYRRMLFFRLRLRCLWLWLQQVGISLGVCQQLEGFFHLLVVYERMPDAPLLKVV